MGIRARRLRRQFDDAYKVVQPARLLRPAEWSLRFTTKTRCDFHAACNLCGHESRVIQRGTVLVLHRCPASPAADPYWRAA